MNIGTELRNARERLGLSREQISSATKIHPDKIEALETDAFDRLPRGVYLDGIVAAYAREVGLDPAAFVSRVRERVTPPPPATIEEIAAARESSPLASGGFHLGIAHGMAAFAAVALVLALFTAALHVYPLESMVEPEQVLTQRETPAVGESIRIAERTDAAAPTEVGTSGSDASTDADNRPRVDDPPVIQAPSMAIPTPAAKDEEAVPMPVPVPAPSANARKPSSEPPAPAPMPEPALLPPAPSLAAVEPRSADVEPALAGAWALETLVQSSSVKQFKGLRLGYRLQLRQDGDRVEGTGRKVTENGASLKGAGQTPIAVHGTLDGGRLTLTFGERGARRASGGTFDLVVEDAGVLRGSFSSDAARSAGVVTARRL